jgi:hypothetical protein
MIIEGASVDSDLKDRLPDIVGNLIADGLFVGGDVLEGRRCLMPVETWREAMSAPAPPSDAQLEEFPATKLPWRVGRSPVFDELSAEEKLRNRYDGGFRTAKPVLEAYGSQPDFRRLVSDLRADGWLDWQIASALAPAAVNAHANDLFERGASREAAEHAAEDGMRAAKAGECSVPPWSESFVQSVHPTLQVSLVSALRTWGLDVNHPQIDTVALRRFLSERFGHFDHDLPIGQRPGFPWEQ